MELVFRSMLLEDIEQICAIEQEAFPTPWSAEAFYNELMNNHFAYYIVLENGDGEIIGYGGMWTIMDEAHITNIAIRKPFQGMKLGEKLLGKLQDKAVDLGIMRMTLEVRVTNHIAHGLYEKMGFYSVGTRKGYYTDNNEDAVIMWANLRSKEI